MKPCPFCGDEYASYIPVTYRSTPSFSGGYVICSGPRGCGAQTSEQPTRAEAEAAWGNRPTMDDVLLERLEKIAAHFDVEAAEEANDPCSDTGSSLVTLWLAQARAEDVRSAIALLASRNSVKFGG